MTDGTSQGLFVVVSIVIFGIFVALSYTVFGSEGLSGGIDGLFSDSTGKVVDSIYTYEDVDFTIAKTTSPTDLFEIHNISGNSMEYTFDGQGSNGAGVSVRDFLEFDTEYKVSYDITKISGSLSNIGGHLHVSEKQDIYINGVKQNRRWTSTVEYPNDNNTHHIELYFNTDYMITRDDGTLGGVFPNTGIIYGAGLSLVTNRSSEFGGRAEHRVLVENIRVQKRVNRYGGISE